MTNDSTIRLAVEGCGHGTLHSIYASAEKACQLKNWDGIDLLIICGDFQAVRNASDLNSMAVPIKYREIGDFHEYYSGARVAPYLTLFIGGNHEASNHLRELHYGGWVAPKIYYLGAANVIKFGSVRIAGQSGIWKGYNYNRAHHERTPYNQDDVRSIYHVREIDTRKLLQIRSQIDIGLSHDWPRGVEWLGNWRDLFQKKDLFEADAKAGNLGSVAARVVLEHLRPMYWFSAHLHIKYVALVNHSLGALPLRGPQRFPTKTVANLDPFDIAEHMPHVHNDDEISLDLGVAGTLISQHGLQMAHSDAQIESAVQKIEEDDGNYMTEGRTCQRWGSSAILTDVVTSKLRAQLPLSFTKPSSEPRQSRQIENETINTITNTSTKFLALDKCLPRREFLQLLEIDSKPIELGGTSFHAKRLCYDPEWLAITRVFLNEYQLGDSTTAVPPDKGRAYYLPLIEEEEQWVAENIVAKDRLQIPFNFSITAPVHNPTQATQGQMSSQEYINLQTTAFCTMLEMHNSFAPNEDEKFVRHSAIPRQSAYRDPGRGRGGNGFRSRNNHNMGRSNWGSKGNNKKTGAPEIDI